MRFYGELCITAPLEALEIHIPAEVLWWSYINSCIPSPLLLFYSEFCISSLCRHSRFTYPLHLYSENCICRPLGGTWNSHSRCGSILNFKPLDGTRFSHSRCGSIMNSAVQAHCCKQHMTALPSILDIDMDHTINILSRYPLHKFRQTHKDANIGCSAPSIFIWFCSVFIFPPHILSMGLLLLYHRLRLLSPAPSYQIRQYDSTMVRVYIIYIKIYKS